MNITVVKRNGEKEAYERQQDQPRDREGRPRVLTSPLRG